MKENQEEIENYTSVNMAWWQWKVLGLHQIKSKQPERVWINIFPNLSLTKKPLETRQGKGKGNPEVWVAVVKEGKIMFEIGEVDEATAREALRLASHKLPIKTKFVKKESGEK